MPSPIPFPFSHERWEALLEQTADNVRVLTAMAGVSADIIVCLVARTAMEKPIPYMDPVAKIGPTPISPEARTAEALCEHSWQIMDRYTDICVHCNSMRPHRGRGR